MRPRLLRRRQLRQQMRRQIRQRRLRRRPLLHLRQRDPKMELVRNPERHPQPPRGMEEAAREDRASKVAVALAGEASSKWMSLGKQAATRRIQLAAPAPETRLAEAPHRLTQCSLRAQLRKVQAAVAACNLEAGDLVAVTPTAAKPDKLES